MGKARISDAAIKKRTGKSWEQWFSILDKANATKMSHKEIAEYLCDKQGVAAWWCQMIAVTYEQDRGLRKKHERPDGYSVSVSKTFDVQLSTLYKYWNDEKLRRQWLKDEFTTRKATTCKSIRFTGDDNTSVEVNFYRKGQSKSQAAVQHSKLTNPKHVEQMRSYWKAALERLKGALG
ncbi:MAG TPA: hypothetical protein VHK86_02000 [Nitrososphaera sp.]|nr:hypothetical protein [Nitrososphaera sp.]